MAPSGTNASDMEKYQDMIAQLNASDTQNPATQDALKALGLEDVRPVSDANGIALPVCGVTRVCVLLCVCALSEYRHLKLEIRLH